MTILEHLKDVLAEARIIEAEGENASIGTEALIWDNDTDLPIDGYAYADYEKNEGNCGSYASIYWLEDIIQKMEIVAGYLK